MKKLPDCVKVREYFTSSAQKSHTYEMVRERGTNTTIDFRNAIYDVIDLLKDLPYEHFMVSFEDDSWINYIYTEKLGDSFLVEYSKSKGFNDTHIYRVNNLTKEECYDCFIKMCVLFEIPDMPWEEIDSRQSSTYKPLKGSKRGDFTFKFKVTRFSQPEPDESEYHNWSRLNLFVAHGDTVYFDIQEDELLTCEEIIGLRNKIQAFLVNPPTEDAYEYFIEPDIELKFWSSHDGKKVLCDCFIAYWDSEGALSAHKLDLCLDSTELKALLCYLQYVTGEEYDKGTFDEYCKDGYLKLLL